MDASRVIICSPMDVMLTELSPDEVWACDETMEINGQHYLEIVTTRVLTKEQRVVVFDEGNHAHEYVVATEDREHSGGSVPFGTYKCPWSLQHDARLWTVNVYVGRTDPVQASVALDAALSGTNRWVSGTVTLATTGSAKMLGVSGWDALSTLIDVWGGEIDAEVTVGQTGITSRRVMLYAQMGQQTATRRFDYLCDLSSIKRHVLQDDVACRIIPRGKSEKGENDVESYVTIESVNDGVEWLQNDESALLYRLAGPNGTYEYPKVYVDNNDIETPQELKDWALSVIDQYTIPKVSYEMEVTYLYHAEYNPYGVGLGDVVQCVDLAFGDTPLRLEARIVAMTVDRLDRSRSTITVSNALGERSLAASVAGLGDWVNEIAVVSGGTAEYIAHILDNLNAEINATGGFVYITDGQGLITYDKSVSNPLVGAEADQATEMKGGTLRFANKKTAQGEWDWTNVITADGYVALAATIARITSGFIGSASGGNYWNLDTGEFRLASTTYFGDGDQTLANYIANATPEINVDEAIFNYLTNNGKVKGIFNLADNRLYINANYIKTGEMDASLIKTGILTSKNGGNFWNLETGEFRLATTTTVGNGSTTLAQYIASVAPSSPQVDVDTAIYNYLTSNSKVQGIFNTDNGRLYINATYINTGTLNASLITSGKIQSQNGKVYFDLTNNELHCDKLVSTDTGTGSNSGANFSASISYRTYNGVPVYGLVAENSSYSDGAILIRPGSNSTYNTNTEPLIQCKRSLTMRGGDAFLLLDTESSGSNHGIYMGVYEGAASIWLKQSSYSDYDMELSTYYKCRWSFSKSGWITWGGYGPTFESLKVSGSKNRVVDTKDYGKRLMNSYETPAPMFGDVGSAVIGDDGICIVSIDDVFQETARTDIAYQVFLQKCGRGDLWVSEKTPTYFVVEGTANLSFDWHLMAHQADFETQRLEDMDHQDELHVMGQEDLSLLDTYEEELRYAQEMESLYY